MKKIKCMSRFLALVLSVCFFGSFSGCDYLDIDKLVSVIGIGIDIDQETGEYLITAEISKLPEEQSQPIEPVLLEGRGGTFSDAIEDMGAKTSGNLYFLHSVLIVFGEEAARAGIGTVVDSCMRFARTQRVVKVAVAREAAAADVFHAKATTSPLISTELDEAIESQLKQFGLTAEKKLYELYNNIPTGLSDLMSVIVIEEKDEETEAKVEGSAIFNEGTLTGFLTPEETQYSLIAMGSFNEGNFRFASSEKDKDFTFHVRSCESGCKPVLQNGELVVEINVEIQGVIPEISSQEFTMEEIKKKDMIQDMKEQLADKIEDTVKKLKNEYSADLFYFKAQAENRYRTQWADWEKEWQDYYKRIPIVVKPVVLVSSNGLSK